MTSYTIILKSDNTSPFFRLTLTFKTYVTLKKIAISNHGLVRGLLTSVTVRWTRELWEAAKEKS